MFLTTLQEFLQNNHKSSGLCTCPNKLFFIAAVSATEYDCSLYA